MATLAVVQTVGYYGSTHDEELVVPLKRRMDPINNSHPPSPARKTTKWIFACLMGMTAAAVASSAIVLLVSIRESSGPAISTEESFLLHASDRADDDKCVPASGPWPTGAFSTQQDDDSVNRSGPYVTCFASTTGGYCWSHAYYDSPDWYPCKPQGFGEVWAFDGPNDDIYLEKVETCGTGCTKFSS